MGKSQDFCELGRAVLETEAAAVLLQTNNVGEAFSEACELLLACQGRIILTGMGKSGHIARKIAATFASTGSPSFFIHAGEAIHGDLGMITTKDVVIALSFSGETQEVIALIPEIKRLGTPIITLTGNPQSSLATEAHITINISIDKEACPLGLAPTSSTTAMLAMGDALAIALLTARGFTKKDFALSHPGGRLGQSLIHVADIMHQGTEIPLVPHESSLQETLLMMSEKKLGTAFIINAHKKLLGIFTDGDLRRFLTQHTKHLDINHVIIKDIVKPGCKTIHKTAMVEEALRLMEDKKIMILPVIDSNELVIGVIHMHDLINARIA